MSRGYASLDYELGGLPRGRPDPARRAGQRRARRRAVDHLAPRHARINRGVELCVEDEGVVPRQMFDVAIQAAIGSRVIARTTVKALRKDVTAKCYGGDISRKKKLLEQAEGGQEAHEVGRLRRDSAGGVPRPSSRSTECDAARCQRSSRGARPQGGAAARARGARARCARQAAACAGKARRARRRPPTRVERRRSPPSDLRRAAAARSTRSTRCVDELPQAFAASRRRASTSSRSASPC